MKTIMSILVLAACITTSGARAEDEMTAKDAGFAAAAVVVTLGEEHVGKSTLQQVRDGCPWDFTRVDARTARCGLFVFRFGPKGKTVQVFAVLTGSDYADFALGAAAALDNYYHRNAVCKEDIDGWDIVCGWTVGRRQAEVRVGDELSMVSYHVYLPSRGSGHVL